MIRVHLDEILRARGKTAKELCALIGITEANLSILRSGKARGVRFGTLDKICKYLDCTVGDILRYSNEGDVVFDPFAGLFTVPLEAVKMGRYGIGTELNADYFRDGVGYLLEAEAGMDQPTLFDLLEDAAI